MSYHSHVVDDISHDHKLVHGRDYILILLLDVEGFMFMVLIFSFGLDCDEIEI